MGNWAVWEKQMGKIIIGKGLDMIGDIFRDWRVLLSKLFNDLHQSSLLTLGNRPNGFTQHWKLLPIPTEILLKKVRISIAKLSESFLFLHNHKDQGRPWFSGLLVKLRILISSAISGKFSFQPPRSPFGSTITACPPKRTQHSRPRRLFKGTFPLPRTKKTQLPKHW